MTTDPRTCLSLLASQTVVITDALHLVARLIGQLPEEEQPTARARLFAVTERAEAVNADVLEHMRAMGFPLPPSPENSPPAP